MKATQRTTALAHAVADVAALAALEPHLLRAMADVEVWSGLGWPVGGGTGTRSSSSAPLPERVATALADGELVDVFALDLTEADLRLARLAEDARWLARFRARHTPTARHPDDRATATCNGRADFPGCGRTVADTPADRLRGGLCTACYHRARRARLAVCSCAIYGAAPCNHTIDAGGGDDATARGSVIPELAPVHPDGAGSHRAEGLGSVTLGDILSAFLGPDGTLAADERDGPPSDPADDDPVGPKPGGVAP